MVLPEGEVAHGVVRVQVAVRDQVPGLLVLREVRGERETVVEQRAPHREPGQLGREHQAADAAEPAQGPARAGGAAGVAGAGATVTRLICGT